ncbi:efflux RND transporter periplasmic adaptor subunit [Niastella sp. OAS944]|uniref:efflux RND transporter periplasmic adaptor subunit n=1 Tax=Niastella sp. OAS944 TaxID=2664089 RepID=UPI0035C7AB2C|nr:RND family efflux transporter MFP subunit [Chitinophagaceae bacterium OAS944]
MKSTYNIIGATAVVLLMTACGGKSELEKKKAELEKLKTEQTETNAKVTKLEKEIAKLDTSFKLPEKPKLVVLTPISTTAFTHYIDLQGKIETDNAAVVTPRGQGGQVKAIYVKQGDNVRKGQLLMKLDDAVTRRQIEQANVQLKLAQDLYQRRKNLWDQKIGTEVELLNAKSNVENLEKQIDLFKEELNMSNVYAEIGGVAERVNIKVGETFSGATAAMFGITIVNTSNLKVTANVPESYQTKVKEGTNLVITLPEDNNKSINTKVSVAGKLIDPSTRSFYIEGRISGNNFRPGQIAMVRIQDYAAPKAITVPINVMQNDEKGKFVMVAAKENGKHVARKRPITTGALYGDTLEVKSGLQTGDVVITEGFQGLYDGQAIITDAK